MKIIFLAWTRVQIARHVLRVARQCSRTHAHTRVLWRRFDLMTSLCSLLIEDRQMKGSQLSPWYLLCSPSFIPLEYPRRIIYDWELCYLLLIPFCATLRCNNTHPVCNYEIYPPLILSVIYATLRRIRKEQTRLLLWQFVLDVNIGVSYLGGREFSKMRKGPSFNKSSSTKPAAWLSGNTKLLIKKSWVRFLDLLQIFFSMMLCCFTLPLFSFFVCFSVLCPCSALCCVLRNPTQCWL